MFPLFHLRFNGNWIKAIFVRDNAAKCLRAWEAEEKQKSVASKWTRNERASINISRRQKTCEEEKLIRFEKKLRDETVDFRRASNVH